MNTYTRVPPQTKNLIDNLKKETELRTALESMVRLSTMPIEEKGSPTKYNQSNGEPIMDSIPWQTTEKRYGTKFSLDDHFDQSHDIAWNRTITGPVAKQIMELVSKDALLLDIDKKQYALTIEKYPVAVWGDRFSTQYSDLPFLWVREVKYL